MLISKKTGFIILLLLFSINIHSKSAYYKTREVYTFTLNIMREIDTVIKNFPGNGNKDDFDKIKIQFQDAGETYFGQDFVSAYEKFKTLNDNLSQLLKKLAKLYLDRSKMILDSASKDSFNILIEYGPNSSYLPYFNKPYDPLRGIKPYTKDFTEKEYHYFFDREIIKSYLEHGYKKYQHSKDLFNDPELEVLKNRKVRTMKIINYFIKRYMDIISSCRQAKQYGIEIHKILRIHMLGDILSKYNITNKMFTPIYDDRIPKDFKVDAVDNIKLLYTVELQRLEKVNK